MSNIEQRVKKIVAEHLGVNEYEVKNESSEKALRGLSGTQVDQNNQGTFLCSYTPLQIKDVNWVLMSTMSETEVSEKIYALRQL